jgi:hypothetical protein
VGNFRVQRRTEIQIHPPAQSKPSLDLLLQDVVHTAAYDRHFKQRATTNHAACTGTTSNLNDVFICSDMEGSLPFKRPVAGMIHDLL